MSEVVVRAQEIGWEISQELIQEISLHPYRIACLLRDHDGRSLLRVLAKEAQRGEPPVSPVFPRWQVEISAFLAPAADGF